MVLWLSKNLLLSIIVLEECFPSFGGIEVFCLQLDADAKVKMYNSKTGLVLGCQMNFR